MPVVDPQGVAVDHVLTPIVGGKIEGGAPDKVLFYRCPDNALRGFRVYAGDLLLTVPASKAEDDRIMLICDTIGLGIFTVVGSSAAIDAGYGDNRFLIVFVGVLTGVGGGMIRDMMAGTMPYIFVKHIYAVASLAGGLLFALIYPYLPRLGSMMTGAVFVMLLRYFAARYRWNLPRIR